MSEVPEKQDGTPEYPYLIDNYTQGEYDAHLMATSESYRAWVRRMEQEKAMQDIEKQFDQQNRRNAHALRFLVLLDIALMIVVGVMLWVYIGRHS